MVDFRGISPARQPQAIHTVPDTMPKTHCSFSVFISAPFAHEFHWLTHSEQHTVDNDTYSIIHSALNLISFPLFFFLYKTYTLHTPSLRTTQTYKVQKCTHVLFPFELRSQTYNKSNTHTKHTNMLRNKILKSVTDTWSNAHMIPKGTTLNTLLPAGEGKRNGSSRIWAEKEEVYMMSVPGGDWTGDGTEQEGVKTGSQQPFITLEGDREAERRRMVNISRW